MLRMLVGTVLAGSLVAARAAADALPYDPATEKSIDGAAVLLDLDKYPDYTFLFFDGGCFSSEEPDGERLGLKVGDERLGCGYRVVDPGVAYRGVSYEAPNGDSGEFGALPAKRFPVKNGKVPALDRLPFGTLVEWRESEQKSPLIALGSPPLFIELHRFSERTGFTDYLRVTSPCGAPMLQLARREWQLENGEVIVQAQPDTTPSCEPAPVVEQPGLDLPPVPGPPSLPVVPAEPVVPLGLDEPVVPVPVVPVMSSGGVEDMFEETAGSLFGARELVLGGVCLLVGLGSGLALRRRPGR